MIKKKKKKSMKKKVTKKKLVKKIKKKVSKSKPVKSKVTKKKVAKVTVVQKKIKSKRAEKKTIKKIQKTKKTAPQSKGIKEFAEIVQMLVVQRTELLKMISKSTSRERDISKLEHGDYQDMAATSLEREMTFVMGSREREEFRMIDAALEKIAKGSYGICDSCGEKINKKRLKIVPFALYCIECKSNMEQEIEREVEDPFS